MKWRLLNTGCSQPALNMALDEACMILLSQGKVPPTVRFYGWNPPGISIGYLQSANDIDEYACKAAGVQIVRRITGGRAVFHDDELTYSLLVPESYSLFPNSVLGAYKVICCGIMCGLRYLGIPADMDTSAGTGKRALNPHSSAACFDASSRHEIVVNGRKLVGSAQCRKHRVLLQHGSIINSFDVEKFFSLLRFPISKRRERLKAIFLQKATSIEEILGYRYPFATLVEAFAKGFRQGLNIDLELSEPTQEELSIAEVLVKEKYANESWNFRR